MHKYVIMVGLMLLLLTALATSQLGAQDVSAEEKAKIEKLIEQLAAPEIEDRERAEVELLNFGRKARPFVQQATESTERERQARAKAILNKLEVMVIRPELTYGAHLPGDTIFFFETQDAARLFQRWKTTAAYKGWRSDAMRKWWRIYSHPEDGELDEDDKKTYDFVSRIVETLDGRSGFAIGSPNIIDEREIEPPFVFFGESKSNSAQFHALIRALYNHLGDPAEAQHRHKIFTIDEHLTMQGVVADKAYYFSPVALALEAFLDGLANIPAALNSLGGTIDENRKLLDDPDVVIHAKRDGLDKVANAGHAFDKEMLKLIDTFGLTAGSTLDGAARIDAEGAVEEHYRVKTGPDGVFPILSSLPFAARAEGASALDMVPAFATFWASLPIDMTGKEAEVAAALRVLDKAITPAIPEKGPRVAATDDPKRMAQRELWYTPKIELMERLSGLKFEQLLQSMQGPLELAALFKKVGTDEPETVPIGYLISVMLKESATLKAGLEQALKDNKFSLKSRNAGGGTYYYREAADLQPGFWIGNDRMLFASEVQVLNLSLAALENKTGQDRLIARSDVKQLLAANRFTDDHRFTLHVDSGALLEMCYNLGRIHWGSWDEENVWPRFDPMKKSFVPWTMHFTKSTDRQFEIRSRSPLSIPGMFVAIRKPLMETGYW